MAALSAPATFAQTPGQVTPTPGPAPSAESDNAIDARIRASAEAAESLQGPLDGGWTLVSTAGTPLYGFELVDKPGGQAPLEGVWRDLRKVQGPGDINFIDSVTRGVDTLSISFFAKPGDPAVTVDLKNAAGGWTGQLREGSVTTDVKLRRN
jgi:hypothetical protein